MEFQYIVAPHRSVQLPSRPNELAELHVGNKALSLLKLLYGNIPTPQFFVIPSTVFKRYILGLPHAAVVNSLEDFRTLILNNYLPKEVMEEVDRAYRGFANFGRAWVSVRPSIVFSEPQGTTTFAGQLTTLLNIKDTENIERAIKEVYASLFSPGVAMYMRTHNLKYSQLGVAVVIQKMVQAEVSGVTYTMDPITLDQGKMAVEAVFGLGDVISNGEITPDFYLVDKEKMSVVEKKVIPQEWMRVREIINNNELTRTKKLEISKIWQYAQKLEEPQIIELTKVCRRIEEVMNKAQHIEWVYEGGKIWILQTREFTQEPAGALMEDEEIRIDSINDLSKFVEHHPEDVQPLPAQKTHETLNVEKKLVFVGQGASSGIATAKALVVFAEEYDTSEKFMKLINSLVEPTILVTDELAHYLEEISPEIKGIVTDYGGVTSDAAVLAREVGIPAVVGSRTATKFIKNGQWINIDGASGAVYRIEDEDSINRLVASAPPEEINPQRQEIEKKLTELKSLLQNIDDQGDSGDVEAVQPDAKLPLPETTVRVLCSFNAHTPPTELGFHGVVVKASDIFVHTGRHPMSYLKNKKRTVFVKKAVSFIQDLVKKQQSQELVLVLDTLSTQQAYHLIGGQKYHDENSNSSLYYEQNSRILKLLLEVIKKLKNEDAISTLSIGLNGLITPDQVALVKRALSANNWRRASNSRLYVMVDAPGIIAQLEMILEKDVDGFIVDLPGLYERSFNQRVSPEQKMQSRLLEFFLQAIGRASTHDKVHVLSILPELAAVDNYQSLLTLALQNGTTMIIVADPEGATQREIIAQLQKTEKQFLKK